MLKSIKEGDVFWLRSLRTGELVSFTTSDRVTDETTYLALSLNTLLDNPNTHTWVDGEFYAFGFHPVGFGRGPVGGGIGSWTYIGEGVVSPSVNEFSFNTSSFATATSLYIHQSSTRGSFVDSGPIFEKLRIGDFIYIGNLEVNTGAWFRVAGTPAETGTVWTIPLDGNGQAPSSAFLANEECFIHPVFIPSDLTPRSILLPPLIIMGAVQCTNLNEWYGPINGQYFGNPVWTQPYGTGVDPTVPIFYVGPTVPYDCKVTHAEVWYRPSNSTIAGKIALYRIRYTNASATISSAQVGTDFTIANSNQNFYFEQSAAVTTNNTLLQGDIITPFFRYTAGANRTMQWRISLVLEPV